MRSGVGFGEILVILVLIIVLIHPKQMPGLLRKSLRIVARMRSEVRKFLDEINKLN